MKNFKIMALLLAFISYEIQSMDQKSNASNLNDNEKKSYHAALILDAAIKSEHAGAHDVEAYHYQDAQERFGTFDVGADTVQSENIHEKEKEKEKSEVHSVIEKIGEEAKKFDEIIQCALREKYSHITDIPDPIKYRMFYKSFEQWSVFSFFNLYIAADHGKYPEDRLGKLCAQIKDVQLEFFYIREVDLGLYNANIHGKGYDPKIPNKSPLLLLRRLSYDQNLIVKSRILWEKIMNFIYYLETGEDLESKKSKKGAFFKFVAKNTKWNFLLPIQRDLNKHDDSYRNPEVHKGSTLKKELISPKIDANELMVPVNLAQNIIWQNIELIISGNNPLYFYDIPS